MPRTRDFWHDLKVTNKIVRVTLGVGHGGKVVPLTMVFRHHASDELVYCEPAPEALEQREALEAAAALEVSILYPMSGIAAEEAVILPNRVDYHLGRGSTAEVVRNLCLLVAKRSGGDWERIVQVMRRLFQVDLGQPAENERGAVDLSYSQPGTKGSLDLSLAGRGFQQMLLIFAHLFAHKRSVLLIDEPDAHLEILRRRQVYILLREIAAEVGSQVILVTHSEVILDAALDRNLTLLLDAKADSLAAKPDIRDTLKHYGAAHYLKARERGYVLYVEGGTDIDMLEALAARLGHAVSKIWDERLNVYFVQDNYPARSVESELERAEGGFGITPREHFFALRSLIPTLKGLAILDNNGCNRTGSAEGGLEIAYWRRYEAENYFIAPTLLVDHARAGFADLELFGSMEGEIRAVMDGLVLERVFEGDRHSFETYRAAAPDAAALIWQCQDRKTQDERFCGGILSASGGQDRHGHAPAERGIAPVDRRRRSEVDPARGNNHVRPPGHLVPRSPTGVHRTLIRMSAPDSPCPMLRSFGLANFKAFGQEVQRLELKPLTLVFGPNSSGKSSLVHSLLLAHHATHFDGDLGGRRTDLGGNSVDLGGFWQYLHGRGRKEGEVVMEFEMAPPVGYRFRSPLLAKCAKLSVEIVIRATGDSPPRVVSIAGSSKAAGCTRSCDRTAAAWPSSTSGNSTMR